MYILLSLEHYVIVIKQLCMWQIKLQVEVFCPHVIVKSETVSSIVPEVAIRKRNYNKWYVGVSALTWWGSKFQPAPLPKMSTLCYKSHLVLLGTHLFQQSKRFRKNRWHRSYTRVIHPSWTFPTTCTSNMINTPTASFRNDITGPSILMQLLYNKLWFQYIM